MNIEYIKEFVILAENKNYNETSEKMFISQSTLFKHIKALENELGVTLFQKVGRKIEITSYGEHFLPKAVEMVRLWELCVSEAATAKDSESSLIRIGTEYKIQDLVNQFYSLNLGYRILSNGSGSRRRLLDRKCDLAILTTGLESELELKQMEDFNHIKLTDEYLILLANKRHPLARRSSVNVEEFFHETFIDMENSADGELDLVGRLFRQYHRSPIYCRNAENGPEAISHIVEGRGLAVMHGKHFENVEAYNDQIAIINIEPAVPMELGIWYPKDVRLSKACQKFIDFAVDYFREEDE